MSKKNGSNGSLRLGARWLRGGQLDVESTLERVYGSPKGERRSLRRGLIPLQISGETWELRATIDDPALLAWADAAAGQVFVNRNYEVPRGPRGAQQEHVLLMLLGAIGVAKHPHAAEAALRYVAERRQEIAAAQRSREA
jgi:hypothetical protein